MATTRWFGVELPMFRQLHENLLPPFQLEALCTINRLGSDAFGAQIRRDLSHRLSRDVAIGQVFACLATLEKNGLIEGIEESPSSRASRKKRVYRLTACGLEAVRRSAAAAIAFNNPAALKAAKA
ncbi:MAG: PadR family transcriptional regulator [Hyphomicrobium sp.]|uniref:PadR family transcriptional regulator n=1 Tax=Hyphomicrobium sp. TaxID=82 RepID=UPI00132ABC52|nr:PadR family transcriptional regulator [Hyphomicrobium sp.]KAB2940093.1 MAG: PadR family transcriptional regulator [Hyphomicrobium sp.]MBZ0208276.1 PadR family transcriptional regulator [Hyphomicrobium sp.]